MTYARRLVPLALLGAALSGCRGGTAESEVPLYQDLGSFHVPVSTRNDAAQAYFDQGMRLTYAFNHGEAVRAFEEAARRDPTCAMCPWGAALALGPNINVPMDSAGHAGALAAIAQARARAANASDRERALIEALAARYEGPPGASRAGLDSAYARAMASVARSFPDDLEAATLHADALMNLRPWDYWDGTRPRPGTDLILAELERVIARDSTHPGACHLFIHAVEAVDPDRAIPCAERLASLMPGAGHLVHMPAHIWVRVGRYDEAIEHNQHATHADESFAATERPSPTYAAVYMPHNYHFLAFAATLAARSSIAIDAARQTTAKVPRELARDYPELIQPLIAFEHLTLLKFGRWEELLALPVPEPDLAMARGLALYARGTALAATGQVDSARRLVDSVQALAREYPDDGIPGGIMAIAHHSLAGEIAARSGQWREAETHFRAAVSIEDGLGYMEPPWWVEPVRQPLGRVLLDAGNARAAAQVYREDLQRFPKNCWSLFGLWQASRAGGAAGAPATEADFRTACNRADVTLTSSHF